MKQIGIQGAKANLSRLIQQALDGEDVVITRNGRAVVRLVPVVQAAPTLASVRGRLKGKIRIADDFDELPDDLADALGAR